MRSVRELQFRWLFGVVHATQDYSCRGRKLCDVVHSRVSYGSWSVAGFGSHSAATDEQALSRHEDANWEELQFCLLCAVVHATQNHLCSKTKHKQYHLPPVPSSVAYTDQQALPHLENANGDAGECRQGSPGR